MCNFVTEIGILVDGTRKSATDLAVELWVYDILEEEKCFKERKQYFDTSKYIMQLARKYQTVDGSIS